MKRLALIFLLFSQPAFASEVISDFSDKSLPVLNEELREINSAVQAINNGYAISSTTGILAVSRGGTGQNFSAATADTVAYFDSTGHMALSSSSSGSTTTFLRGDFSFAQTPDLVRFISKNPLNGTEVNCSGVACVASATDLIDTTTDWSGKKLVFEGVVTVANSTLPAAVDFTGITSTSSTALTGFPFTGTVDLNQVYTKFFWTASTTNKTFVSIAGGITGEVTCQLDVNGSGQLVMVTNLVGTAGGGNAGFCRLDDVIIIRER